MTTDQAMTPLERYHLAVSLGGQPCEASARRLIAMLGDDKELVVDEGCSVYDVEPTHGRVSEAARASLEKMSPFAVPVIIEELASANASSVREMLAVLDVFPIEQRVALSDEAHAAIESAAQKLRPLDAEHAQFERDFARRAREGEFATAEAFWRAWLAHPTRAFHALYELADLVEDRAAFARELAAWLDHPKLGSTAAFLLERFPGLLPPETVRLLAASQLPREHHELVPLLAAYGEPAAALIPQCLEMLRNEPFDTDGDSRNSRHVRWHRATKALVLLVDAIDARVLEVLEPMLAEMADTPGRYQQCGTQLRAALAEARRPPTPGRASET